MTLDSTVDTVGKVRDLLAKDASLKFEVIGDGIYQIDGFGTYGHWTCLVNDNLTTTDLLLPAVVYVCEEPEACVHEAMKMVEYCMTEYIARSIPNQSEDPVIVV